jgi:pimeloyl-ACP methyl ester carboxylesterase
MSTSTGAGVPELAVRELSVGAPGAPLVVLVHGLEDSWASWWPLAERLADWRLVALDLPWRAGGDYRWRHRSAGDWLRRGLDLVGEPVDAVVAHSFGAGATLELLCARDRRLGRAAALLAPLYRPPQLDLTWRVFDRARRTFEAHLAEGLAMRLGARAKRLEGELLDLMVSRTIDRVGPAGFLAVFDQFAATAHLPLERVELATLVLAGDADPTLLGGAALQLAGGLPGSRVHIQPGYDHFCHVRHANGVAAEIADLVNAALGAVTAPHLAPAIGPGAGHSQEVPQ